MAKIDNETTVVLTSFVKANKNEMTSKKVGALAARAMTKPSSLTVAEIRVLAASVLTQLPDKK